MSFTQLFETTIADRQHGYTLRFMAVPRLSMGDDSDLAEGVGKPCQGPESDSAEYSLGSIDLGSMEDDKSETEKDTESEREKDPLAEAKQDVIDTLRLEELHKVRPAALPQVIGAMIRADRATNFKDAGGFMEISSLLGKFDDPTPTEAFAEYASFANVIPFKESPVSLVSLAGKAAEIASKPESLGAFIGVAAGGFTPLLLITVPTGIILCGTAVAFSKVIDENRQELLECVMGVLTKEVDSHRDKPEHRKKER